jgi:hypothetical protein
MAPIKFSEDQVALATIIFSRQMTDFLIKYLGIPLSLTKLPKLALQPLLDKVTDKLRIWKVRVMHHSSRLTLIKMIMSAVPVYTSISFRQPSWLLKLFQKLMRAFLWTWDMVQSGKRLVAWCRIQRPLHISGHGRIGSEATRSGALCFMVLASPYRPSSPLNCTTVRGRQPYQSILRDLSSAPAR